MLLCIIYLLCFSVGEFSLEAYALIANVYGVIRYGVAFKGVKVAYALLLED